MWFNLPWHPKAASFWSADLLVNVGVRDTEDPILVCYCFGFTQKDVPNEIIETGHSTGRSRLPLTQEQGIERPV